MITHEWRVRSSATLNTAADVDIMVAIASRGGAAMVVRAVALLLLLNPSVGQPELSDACRDPARRNPCEGHREVACFLAGISLREVHHLRAWVRDPEMEAKAHQMNHQQDEEKEVEELFAVFASLFASAHALLYVSRAA